MRCVLHLVNEFSEWDKTCQQCKFFKNCQETDEKNKDMINYGDNAPNFFPNYNTIHLRKMFNAERANIIEKLIITGLGSITKDDIINIQIDLELYNKQCRKEKIKDRYKRKKENE